MHQAFDRLDIKASTHLPPLSLQNEVSAWKRIAASADAALALYPTTLQQDTAILEIDRKENNLSESNRNCVKYRRSEKVILHFLKDCAQKVMILSQKTQREARAALDEWKDMYGYLTFQRYYEDVLSKLLSSTVSTSC